MDINPVIEYRNDRVLENEELIRMKNIIEMRDRCDGNVMSNVVMNRVWIYNGIYLI